MSKNYYQILGVSLNAIPEEIKKAFIRLALKHHPDKGGSKEKFQEIKKAYDYLSKKDRDNFATFGSIDDILEEIERARATNEAGLEENMRVSIEIIEKAFILHGVSPQDLDPNLWGGYYDWRDKLESLKNAKNCEEFNKFQPQLYNIILEVWKRKKENQKKDTDRAEESFFKTELENLQQRKKNYREENNYWQGNKDLQQSPHFPQPSENNSKHPLSPNDCKPPERPHSDRTKYLETEIEYYKRIKKNVPENEKQSVQRIIEKLEKELEEIKAQSNTNYDNLTGEQLISEIKKLKAELEELKSNKSIDSSKRQVQLQAKLEKLEKARVNDINQNQSHKPDNNFPTNWVIGGGILIAVGLMAVLVIKKNKKKRK